MKLGEIIDYMMENEIVSTIKTNDGNVIINGELHTDINFPNDNPSYKLNITRIVNPMTFKILELSKTNWEAVNYSTENKLSPDTIYRNLSYEYENVFGEHKTSVREFNNISNIKRRCKYNGYKLITTNLH